MASHSTRGSQIALLSLELAAIVLLLVQFLPSGEAASSGPPIVEVPFDALEKIVLQGVSETVTLERSSSSETPWQLLGGEPADTRVVFAIFRSLAAAKEYHRAPSRPPQDLGFSPPRGRIELYAGGRPIVIELGAKNEFLGGTYIREGEGDVLFTQDLLFDPELVTRAAFLVQGKPNPPQAAPEQVSAGEMQ